MLRSIFPVLLMAAPAEAQVRLIDAGIVCPRPPEGELREAPDTESGFIRSIAQDMLFDLPDLTVPTLHQLSFGFRTQLDRSAPATDVTVVVTHPPMGPSRAVRQTWNDTMDPGQDTLNLFTFEFDYEKVTGPWSFSIEIEDQPIVIVPFTVTESENRGRVEQICFQFLS